MGVFNAMSQSAMYGDVMTASALLLISIIFAAMGMTKMPHHEKFTTGAHTFAILFVGMAIAVAVAARGTVMPVRM